MNNKYIEKLGGRKLTLGYIIFILTTILLINNKISENEYSSIVFLIIGTYSISSLIQNYYLNNETSEKILNEIVSIKVFRLVILILFTTSIITFFKLINPSIYIHISELIYLVYNGSNVIEKLSNIGISFGIIKK